MSACVFSTPIFMDFVDDVFNRQVKGLRYNARAKVHYNALKHRHGC